MESNRYQVGGNHYAGRYQHWDFVQDCHLGYLEGNITKYIGRARKKNGVEDLRKALHYTGKLMEEVMQYGMRPPHSRMPWGYKCAQFLSPNSPIDTMFSDFCDSFAESSGACFAEIRLIKYAVMWGTPTSTPMEVLQALTHGLSELIAAWSLAGVGPGHNYVSQD